MLFANLKGVNNETRSTVKNSHLNASTLMIIERSQLKEIMVDESIGEFQKEKKRKLILSSKLALKYCFFMFKFKKQYCI